MTHAFSRIALQDWAAKALQGEFKHFRETVFGMAAQRAERASLELALFLRYLDDEEGLSDHYARDSRMTFGALYLRSGKTADLGLRDVANKIIHAASFDWDLSRPHQPMLVCISREEEKWLKAHVDVANISVACGSLAG